MALKERKGANMIQTLSNEEMLTVDGGSWGCAMSIAETGVAAATFFLPGAIIGGLFILAEC
jgi:hypothetical protein